MVAAAIGGAAVIGAAGSIIGSHTQANAQQSAANTQADMFNKIVGQEQPFIQSGYGAVNQLSGLMGLPTYSGSTAIYPGTPMSGAQQSTQSQTNGQNFPTGNVPGTNLPAGYLTQTFTPDQFLNSPQYQFQMEQGGQALRNSMTPGVGALSGAALKSLENFNQGLASTYYNDYFNNFQTQQNNIFNRLSNVASLGQNAAGNLGSAGTQLGTGIAQAQAGAGASLGAGYSSAASNLGQGLSLAGLLGNSGSSGGGFTPDPSVMNWQAPTSFFSGGG